MMTHSTFQSAADKSLGSLIHDARIEAELTFRALSAASGVAQGQISKLEKGQVLKVNPAHIAALAEPLGLSLYSMYAAAGYKTPASLSQLSDELEEKIRQLPPDAVVRLERYVESLLSANATRLASEPAYDTDPATNN